VKFVPLLWASLWRKRARTVLTLFSITVAFLLFGVLQGVNAWLDGYGSGAAANRLYVVSRISQIQPLPRAHLQRITRVAGVREATYVSALIGSYQQPGNTVLALASQPQVLFHLNPEWQVPPQQLQALVRTRTGAIVGARLASLYGWKIGDVLPLHTSTLKQDGSVDWAFQIVGIYDTPAEPAEANRVIANYDYIDEARHFDRGSAYAFIVGIDDPSHSADICAAVDALFANSADETLTQDEKGYAQEQFRQIGDIGYLVNAIVAAAFFTLLFLTGNTMMQSVRDRIPELAVLKAIGFTDGAILLLVLGESILICVAAAAIGLLTAAALFPATAALGIAGTILPARVLATGAILAVALALVSGLPPAWRARQLSIVDALAAR
jgi:putative ABC transport system permease protein